MFGIGQKELIILLVIILIIFGPKNLPRLARSIGKSMRELKDSMSGFSSEVKSAMHEDENEDADPAAETARPRSRPNDQDRPGATANNDADPGDPKSV